jgi:hypothetical protein
MDANARCQTCSYWESRAPKNREASPDGECHKDAPQLLSTSAEGFGSWPKTAKFDWCGDWALASEAAELHAKRQRGELT